jgi:hypothetical protein
MYRVLLIDELMMIPTALSHPFSPYDKGFWPAAFVHFMILSIVGPF